MMYLIEIKNAKGERRGYWFAGRTGMRSEPARIATVVEATRYESKAQAAAAAALLLEGWNPGDDEGFFVGLMEV